MGPGGPPPRQKLQSWNGVSVRRVTPLHCQRVALRSPATLETVTSGEGLYCLLGTLSVMRTPKLRARHSTF